MPGLWLAVRPAAATLLAPNPVPCPTRYNQGVEKCSRAAANGRERGTRTGRFEMHPQHTPQSTGGRFRCTVCGREFRRKSCLVRGVFDPALRHFCGDACVRAARVAAAPSAVDRFWASVNKDGPVSEYRPDLGPCWLWKGAYSGRASYRYGAVRAGLLGHKTYAHRVAYELVIGPIPEGLEIDHLCRVTMCCNPSHLEPVTSAVNVSRSRGPAAHNAAKTHCVRGHPFDDENTLLTAKGRRCKACQELRIKADTARRRAARLTR